MPAGADKVITYDPPGAIGLVDPDAIVLLRFNDTDAAAFPQDSAGSLQDMGTQVAEEATAAALAMPAVVPGSVGRARQFDPYVAFAGLSTRDIDSGSTLLTRDMSIQVILSWNAAHQDLDSGAIITRGIGNIAYGLQIDLVDAASFTGSLRWLWRDVGGTLRLQDGAEFVNLPGEYTMLTATRRWISPTSVLLRYYVGDTLIGEVDSADGSIGGSTTGITQIGTRIIDGTDQNFLAANIDELMVLDRELCIEEIEAAWLRITVYQPLGYQIFREMHDPGFPLPNDPSSDVQLDTRMIGQALGYCAAQIENLRANFLPGRSYGTTLEQWEELVGATTAPASGIEDRRARVDAKMQQRLGVSPEGLRQSLQRVIGDATPADLVFLAFSNRFTDDFTETNRIRWDVHPSAGWVMNDVGLGGRATPVIPAGASYLFDGTNELWRYAQMSVGGNAFQAHLLAKVTMPTPVNGIEVGLFFGDRVLGNFILLGLRDTAGTFSVVHEVFVGRVSQGVVTVTTFGSNPPALWLHLFNEEADDNSIVGWSITSATAGFTFSPSILRSTIGQWGGMYARSIGVPASSAVAEFRDFVLYAPFSGRTSNAYVLLDEALGFSPDVSGAQSVIRSIKHAFTHAAFITQPQFLLGDPASGLGVGPLGGY